MRNTRFFILLILMALVLPFGAVTAQDGSFVQSVCLITDIGRVNDGTFNEFAYDGMLRAVEEFGLEDTFIETASVSDYANNINVCLEGEYDVIITVGFALADAAYAAAEANPDVFFIGVDQDFTASEPLPNIVGIQFREDQAGFLAGSIAALMTESGIVAGVYGDAIFPVVKFRHGFETGAVYIDPEIRTLGIYIPDFQAPDQGQEAARQFIGDGADVIFGAGGPTGSGGISYAASEGILVIGVDQDEYFTTFGGGESPGAENLLTSALKRVDVGVYEMVALAVEEGAFPENSTFVLEIANDGIDFGPTHDASVPEEVIDTLVEIREGMRDGTIWTGIDPVTGDYLPTLAEAAESAGVFDTLLAAADAAGLTGELLDGGPYTIFAPTDEAFGGFLSEADLTAEELLADTETLTAVLSYHVVDRALVARAVVEADGTSVATLNGAEVAVSVNDGVVFVNESAVVQADVLIANGVVHAIDTVLVPPSE